MQRTVRLSFAIVLVSLAACSKEEVTDAPKIEISQVTDVTVDGATFYGKIDALGSSSWTDYGFIWSITNPPSNIGIYSFGQSPIIGPFSHTVSNSWLSGTNYFVFAFVKKGGGLTISSPIVFFAPVKVPEVYDFSPKTGSAATQVHVTGKYLDLLQNPILKIGDISCSPDLTTPGEIIFHAPNVFTEGTFPLFIYATGVTMQLNGTFTLL